MALFPMDGHPSRRRAERPPLGENAVPVPDPGFLAKVIGCLRGHGVPARASRGNVPPERVAQILRMLDDEEARSALGGGPLEPGPALRRRLPEHFPVAMAALRAGFGCGRLRAR